MTVPVYLGLVLFFIFEVGLSIYCIYLAAKKRKQKYFKRKRRKRQPLYPKKNLSFADFNNNNEEYSFNKKVNILRNKDGIFLKKSRQFFGTTVTRRIKQVKQPYGGYLHVKDFDVIKLGDDELFPDENINPSLMGMAVDYMSRFMSGTNLEKSFFTSLVGATIIKEEEIALKLLENIKGLDDLSLTNALKLTQYDCVYRAGILDPIDHDKIKPDEHTLSNLKKMIERSIFLFNKYGSVVLDGFDFEGGYTDTVVKGDGDFLTQDTLWEFKVLRRTIDSKHTLQLLMYWRMGLHSIHPEFKNIKYLGIFNPCKNIVYRIPVEKIPLSVIQEVEAKVIGYDVEDQETVQ